MTDPTIKALRERVQTATEGSRELDAEVARALGYESRRIKEKGGYEWDRWYRPHNGKLYALSLPAFTSRPDDPSAAVAELRRRGWKFVWCYALEVNDRITASFRHRETDILVNGHDLTPALAATDALLAVVERERRE